MKLSIITPTFNSAPHLAGCLESVASQTGCEVEHLIVDGASKDTTVSLIQTFADRYPHIRYLSEKDDGIYDAMNKGIRLATGDYVLFLGSDDRLFDSDVVRRAFSHIETSRPGLAYGNVKVRGTGLHGTEDGGLYDGEFTVGKLLQKNICHQAIFYSKDLLDQAGFFNTRYRYYADWEYNLRCFAKARTQYLDMIIAHYSTGGVSTGGQDLEFHLNFFDEARRSLGITVFNSYYKARVDYLGFVGRLKLRQKKDWRGAIYLLAACWHSPRYILRVASARTGSRSS